MTEKSKIEPVLLKAQEICEMLNISKPHFYTMLRNGKFPKASMKTGRYTVWHRDIVNQWLNDVKENKV